MYNVNHQNFSSKYDDLSKETKNIQSNEKSSELQVLVSEQIPHDLNEFERLLFPDGILNKLETNPFEEELISISMDQEEKGCVDNQGSQYLSDSSTSELINKVKIENPQNINQFEQLLFNTKDTQSFAVETSGGTNLSLEKAMLEV